MSWEGGHEFMSWSHFGGICLLQPTACVQCLSVCGWGLDVCALSQLSCVSGSGPQLPGWLNIPCT